MFERKMTVPTFGVLEAEGSSKVWRGFLQLDICQFGNVFPVLVRGTREGPSGEQIAAAAVLASGSAEIKEAATIPLYQLFLDGGLVFTHTLSSPEEIWRLLRPGVIEFDVASPEWDGAVHTQIGFTSELCPSAFPYISTLDGKFHEVSLET